jgi:hypothetical protein
MSSEENVIYCLVNPDWETVPDGQKFVFSETFLLLLVAVELNLRNLCCATVQIVQFEKVFYSRRHHGNCKDCLMIF